MHLFKHETVSIPSWCFYTCNQDLFCTKTFLVPFVKTFLLFKLKLVCIHIAWQNGVPMFLLRFVSGEIIIINHVVDYWWAVISHWQLGKTAYRFRLKTVILFWTLYIFLTVVSLSKKIPKPFISHQICPCQCFTIVVVRVFYCWGSFNPYYFFVFFANISWMSYIVLSRLP